MDGKAWLEALLDDELVEFHARMRPADVVFVKGVLEASEGLGAVFARPKSTASKVNPHDGGCIVIAGPRSRANEIEEALRDLQSELDVLELGAPGESF